MPTKPLTPCAAPGCPAVSKGRFCDKHTKQYWREVSARQKPPEQRGYNEKWKAARAAFLLAHPYCAECRISGSNIPATDVDHFIPHRGNELLFWSVENWQSLCRYHHRGKTIRDDMPDKVNAVYPLGLRPSAIPLTIVHGPSGSGKTTWVRQQTIEGDMVIDVDEIMASLAGQPMYWASGTKWLRTALLKRNERLLSLADATTGKAWFIVSAPIRAEQWYWTKMLQPERVVVMNTPLDVCVGRLRADTRRQLTAEKYVRLAEQWWKTWVTR